MTPPFCAPVATAVGIGQDLRRLTDGPLWWRARNHDQIGVRLLAIPNNKIDVGIWWNQAGMVPDVQLVFGLYEDSVELGSLKGNGFDAPAFHRLGFGTFAVNIAVQALQAVCAPQTLLHGVLSNTNEAALPLTERMPLETARRAFWRRFGLEVMSGGAPTMDYLRGRVGALRTVAGGRLAGQFPRCVPLSAFEAGGAEAGGANFPVPIPRDQGCTAR